MGILLMYKKILIFSLFVCAAAVFAAPLTVSGKKVELEWKNNVVEFRHKGSSAKVLIYPGFTNGEKIEDAKVEEFFFKNRPGFTLRGKKSSLAFVLSTDEASLRISVPRNAVFKVRTETEAVILPDPRGEDTIVEPGKKALNIPGFLPLFMALQKGENWTLSCIQENNRSDVRLSADLKTWEFTPGTLEEYTLFIHSAPRIWHRLHDKLEQNIRKTISWKAPFEACYKLAMPLKSDFVEVGGHLFYCTWNVADKTRVKKGRPLNGQLRAALTDRKSFTSWSSGFFGSFPYPAACNADGSIEAAYPLHKGRMVYDMQKPIYIYTYDSGSFEKPGFPADQLGKGAREEFLSNRMTNCIGISPATCNMTSNIIEKIFYRSEAREKKREIASCMARMQLFIEAIRSRIDTFHQWADEIIVLCQKAAKEDPSAAGELESLIKTLNQMDKYYQKRLPEMKYPEDAHALQMKLLADIDNSKYDDEELEDLAKAFGRATRTIGGAQDNHSAECRYIARRACQQALMSYAVSSSPAAKKVFSHTIKSGREVLNNFFHHEGK